MDCGIKWEGSAGIYPNTLAGTGGMTTGVVYGSTGPTAEQTWTPSPFITRPLIVSVSVRSLQVSTSP